MLTIRSSVATMRRSVKPQYCAGRDLRLRSQSLDISCIMCLRCVVCGWYQCQHVKKKEGHEGSGAMPEDHAIGYVVKAKQRKKGEPN